MEAEKKQSTLDYNSWTREDLQSLRIEITNIIKRKDLDTLIEWADAYREREEGVGLSSALVEIVNEVYGRAVATIRHRILSDLLMETERHKS